MPRSKCIFSSIKDYEYINEAISDTDIKYLVNMAGISSARAIASEKLVKFLKAIEKSSFKTVF